MPFVNTTYYPQTEQDTALLSETQTGYSLVVWNDEVNTFHWVIDALVEVCHHSPVQAEQCALLIHYQGKYAVKTGSYEELKPMCEGIIDREISATIEMNS